jgi:Zn-dependent alcohol dehydrogenase
MCNQVIMTMSVGRGEALASALAIAAKRGRVVITNVHPVAETHSSMSGLQMMSMEKQVVGNLFGSCSPRLHIPELLRLYQGGRLKLDELITRTYSLDDINVGYDDMRNGRNIRGVLQIS